MAKSKKTTRGDKTVKNKAKTQEAPEKSKWQEFLRRHSQTTKGKKTT